MTHHANRLVHETSPYLLQHAHNPVDWYPWGDDALARAKEEDKPILLSVGYAACHWCHVMERESFEDEETARVMNEHFISIKVDREERPDVDAVYMDAVQAMTGHGGWPMTVFLTPEGVPFYGGTYYPPEPRHGLPAFRDLLIQVAAAYRERQDEIRRTGETLVAHLNRPQLLAAENVDLGPSLLDRAVAGLEAAYDETHGGFGRAPKFPPAHALEFLLRTHLRTGSMRALQIVERTLEKMARGGIYDHLGGGFHRYSVDQVWLVPHFEKMLYDNALLARVYLHA
ncbi:MAG: thioredoxin domain-containing protein, partial [Anaerolineae bacterium]